MAPSRDAAAGGRAEATPACDDDGETVHISFPSEDIEAGIPRGGAGDGGGDAASVVRPSPLRVGDNGEIDEAASRMLTRISNNATATTLGRGEGGINRGEGDERRENSESVEVEPGPSTVEEHDLMDTGASIDPVADAMMEKIYLSASTTQLGRPRMSSGGKGQQAYEEPNPVSYSQDYGPGYEDTLSPKDRKRLEKELNKLRESRLAEMVAEAAAESDAGNAGMSDGTSVAQLTTVEQDQTEDSGVRAEKDLDPMRRSPSLPEATSSSTPPSGETKLKLKHTKSHSSDFMKGMADFSNSLVDGSPRSRQSPRESKPSSRQGSMGDDFFRAFGFRSRQGSQANLADADADTAPPIRIRRTVSYYVGEKLNSARTSVANADPTSKLMRAADVRKRKIEVIIWQTRVANIGKLFITILAGLLAGIVLWAMTIFTAQMTMEKFDTVREMIREDGLGVAWAYYSFWACACLGVTAFAVLHPKGCPMARGSGIPELKGYINGNRQPGLFHWRSFVGRAVGICLVITATMPFGREGPAVHIGACVASIVLNLPWRKLVGWDPSPEERRQILQLGAAAGVAAAFNAPIGGLLYVMEDVATHLPPDYVWRGMIITGSAVGIAQVLYTALDANQRIDYASLVISDELSSTGWVIKELPIVALLSVIAGVAAAAFTLAADFFGRLRRGKVERAPTWMKRCFASKVGTWCDAVLCGLIVASCQLLIPSLFSCRAVPLTGNDLGSRNGRHLQSALYVPRKFVQYTCGAGNFSEMGTLMLQNEEGVVKHLFARDELYTEKLFTPGVVFVFLAYFFCVGAMSFGGAFPAGVFVPNMVMGAALGRLYGFFAEIVIPEANKGTYALIGSAAMLGGFTRMTAAITVILIEATAQLDLLAPLMLSCVIARSVASFLVGHNLDERLTISKGVPFLEHEAHPSMAAMKIGESLKEADKRRGPIIAFRPQERMQVLLNALLLTEHNAFPVLDDVENNLGLRGLVTRAMLQRVLRVVLEKTEAKDEERRNSRDPAQLERKSTFSRRLSGVLGFGNPKLPPRPHVKRRASKGDFVPDEWSVEGLDASTRGTQVPASSDTTSAQATPQRSQRTSMNDCDGKKPEEPQHGQSKSTRAKEGDFMKTVAQWMKTHITHANSAKAVPGAKSNLAERIGAAAERQAAAPATARPDDEHHFDELKEGLLKQIRMGAKHVSNDYLSRKVDLMHAIDKAPWTVHEDTKLARVHALFHRLGVRHMCVVSNFGKKFEGIITRHDLIHFCRLAEHGWESGEQQSDAIQR